MERTPDVVVIGGGPAGASAAIRMARSGRSVRLYEKSRFPRSKLCGGFLSSDGLHDLDDLDLLEPLRQSGAIPIHRTVIASMRGTLLESALPEPALSVSRDGMDQLLLQKARESGVEVRENQNGFLPSHDNGSYLVVAAGRQTQGPAARHPWYASPSTDYVGLQAIFENVRGITDQVELDIIDSGYVGLARLQSHRVNVCTLTTQETVERLGPSLDNVMAHFTRENPVLRTHLANARRVGSWMAVAPVRMGIRRLAQGRTFYVGDAACVVDPFAGEGMSIGLYTSKLLVAALDQKEFPPDEAYRRLWRRAFMPTLRWNSAMRWLYGVKILREPVLRGLQLYPRALTALAELTRHRQVDRV